MLLHHLVLDAGVEEALAVGRVAGALVERQRVGLGGERDAASAERRGPRLALGEQPRRDAAAAGARRDGDAAELDGVALGDEPARRDDTSVLGDGDEVQRVGLVVLVDLLRERDALLDDEDLVAQGEGGADLVRVARRAHLGHPIAYRRMSWTRSARVKYGPWWTNVCLPLRS